MAIKKAENNVKMNENVSELDQPFLTVTEKKIRNLEKRKAKLDGYKSIVEQGGSLDPDQKAAVDKYDEVIGSISTTKELVKTFKSMYDHQHKSEKKLKQKQALEQQELDLKNFQKLVNVFEIFKLVSLNEKVQSDLSASSEEESPVLADKELEMVVAFYNEYLAGIYEEGSDVTQICNKMGEKLYLLCQSSQKKLSNYSYSNLNDTYEKLIECEYFKELPNISVVKNSDFVTEDVDNAVVNEEVPSDDADKDEIDEEAEPDEQCNPIIEFTAGLVEVINPTVIENYSDVNFEDLSSNNGDIKTTEFVASEAVLEGNAANSISTKIEFTALVEESISPEPVVDDSPEVPDQQLTIKDILRKIDGDSFGEDCLGIDFEIPDLPNETETNSESVGSEDQLNQCPTFDSVEVNHIMNNIEPEPANMSIPPVITSHPASNVYSAAPPKSDSLGMGQTTFGNHTNYTAATQNQQLAESMYQTGNFHMHPEMHKPLGSVENALNVHLQMQPKTQMSAMIPSAMSVPDPPKAPIPMPNEELSYKSSYSNMNSSQELNSLGDSNSKPTQDEAVLHLMRPRQPTSMLMNDGTGALMSNDNSHAAPLNKNSESHYCNNTKESTDDASQVSNLSSLKERSDVSISNHAASKQSSEVSEKLTVEPNEGCGKGDHISANDSNARVSRNSGYNGNPSYTKQNSAYRQGSQMHSYFQRGGGNNYRNNNNNQRNYNNYDNRTSYQQPIYSQYRPQDNNGMYNGMRRGGSNPNRGRSSNGRNGGRPFNRSRTFRPQSSEQTF